MSDYQVKFCKRCQTEPRHKYPNAKYSTSYCVDCLRVLCAEGNKRRYNDPNNGYREKSMASTKAYREKLRRDKVK